MWPPQETDRELDLVLRARAGDGQALAELFTRFWRAARASAYAVTGDMASAEDAAAEAFRAALPAMPKLRNPKRFAPWLRRIVVRIARRHSRSAAARAGEPLDEALASPEQDPARALERRELALLVWQAVEQLPPGEREAIVLYYFEGYDSDSAARFIDIPVGSLRRRLHDGRRRLRNLVTAWMDGPASHVAQSTRLTTRLEALLSTDTVPSEWYDFMRDALLTRPVPYDVLTRLAGAANGGPSQPNLDELARRFLTRPHGDLFADPDPVGEAARAVRAALRNFQQWTVDGAKLLRMRLGGFRPGEPGRAFETTPELMPPGFQAGEPTRCFRVTRGLLFGSDERGVVDAGELLVRSGSLTAFTRGMRPAWMSDVVDVYWLDVRPIELSEVEAWVTALAHDIAPGAQLNCVVHTAPRYRAALKLTLADDARPAAIGGVLAGWRGMPKDVQAVLVRLYLEPWAQARSGQPVVAQSIAAPTESDCSSDGRQ